MANRLVPWTETLLSITLTAYRSKKYIEFRHGIQKNIPPEFRGMNAEIRW